MKRLCSLFCVFLVLFSLSSCDSILSSSDNKRFFFSSSDKNGGAYLFDKTTTSRYGLLEGGKEEFRGVWLSFYELSVTDERKTEKAYTAYLLDYAESFSLLGITDVFCHVRPNGDAFYESSFFPSSRYTAKEQGEKLYFDCLKIMCEVFHSYNMNVHAWINPYRAAETDKLTDLALSNKARLWWGSEDVFALGGKLYFNPASKRVQSLVLDGVSELLASYDIEGIHIDDYFYPPSCGDFDKESYDSYIKEGGTLPLDSWRRKNVNSLIKGIYDRVKAFSSKKLFTISPAGDIEKNYAELYADVSFWCREGLCDMIIPQIYFGFENGAMPFEQTAKAWLSLKGNKVKMAGGLALYKVGQIDEYALGGENEWLENNDIIAGQVKLLRKIGFDGFSLYSASSVNFSKRFLKEQLNNLKSVL